MGFLKKLKDKVKSRKKSDEVLEKIKETNSSTYEKGLKKSSFFITNKLNKLAESKISIGDEYFESIEEILIMSDVNYATAIKIISLLKKAIVKNKAESVSECNELLFEVIYNLYGSDDTSLNFNKDGLTVILVIGVNGVGKTTSIAKLSNIIQKSGKSVRVVAGDTFRAGAVDQLSKWAEKLNIGITKPVKDFQDPASVIFKGIDDAIEEGVDVLICDTAGRLQSKKNLMNELNKINSIIEKKVKGGASEVLLVVDSTTGQNAISQAHSFNEVAEITGIVLTKLDGTSKGGVILSIKNQIDIPVKFVGLGEKIDDLQSFNLEEYILSFTEGLYLDEQE
ncbi:MAG: signal recognition particle-docking protein FtsY [Mycoplasmataceae bacterium]|nr:signal recognition particle-docking protein FtsY [Mycoplasmataceae bacterium]